MTFGEKINIFQYLCVFAKIIKIFTLEKAKWMRMPYLCGFRQFTCD